MKIMLKVLIFLAAFYSVKGQDIKSVTEKVADKMCECVGDVSAKTDVNLRINECYESEVRAGIHKILNQEEMLVFVDNIAEFNQKIGAILKNECPEIKNELNKRILSSYDSRNAFPTNFDTKDLERILRNNKIKNQKKLIATNIKVLSIKNEDGKLNYTAEIGNEKVHVAPLIPSGFEESNAELRVLGYLINRQLKDYISEPEHKILILALATLEIETKQLSYIPSAEKQIEQWASGKIPDSK